MGSCSRSILSCRKVPRLSTRTVIGFRPNLRGRPPTLKEFFEDMMGFSAVSLTGWKSQCSSINLTYPCPWDIPWPPPRWRFSFINDRRWRNAFTPPPPSPDNDNDQPAGGLVPLGPTLGFQPVSLDDRIRFAPAFVRRGQ